MIHNIGKDTMYYIIGWNMQYVNMSSTHLQAQIASALQLKTITPGYTGICMYAISKFNKPHYTDVPRITWILPQQYI